MPPFADSIMSPKSHGTSSCPVQSPLRWGVSPAHASSICSFNRHYAERSGHFTSSETTYLTDVDRGSPQDYFDSVTGKKLFTAPRGRTFEQFEGESRSHGWPSFRDEEVNWEEVRVLPDGETVSLDGTHLGHNLPDGSGNRYCINLICVAGNPK